MNKVYIDNNKMVVSMEYNFDSVGRPRPELKTRQYGIFDGYDFEDWKPENTVQICEKLLMSENGTYYTEMNPDTLYEEFERLSDRIYVQQLRDK